MRDDRLFRVLVLGGIGLVGATSSVMACSSETPRPEGPPQIHVEGPPVDRGTATPITTSPDASAASSATSAPTAPASVPNAVHVEGPPPPPTSPPPS